MKAVVVEIKSKKAAVLSDNGCVVTIKNNGYEIGQVIQMNDSKVHFTKKIAVFAASAAALVILSTGAWAYATPYSYVSIDVNPSIEYTINRFDRVLTVKAVNDDGEEILKEVTLDNLKNKTIEAAILKTVEQITVAGYFNTTTEGGIVITTASEHTNRAEELAIDLQLAVEEEIVKTEENIIVEAYSVGLNRVEKARELGVTPGKLNLVEKLQSSSSDPSSVNIEEWLNRSVKDIMEATKDNRKASSVSGSAIITEEKDTDRTKNEKAIEEKLEEQKQQKEERKQQKEEQKRQKEERKQQKLEEQQQKEERKQQKLEEQKRQKEDRKQQKLEEQQQKEERKQQKLDEEKQQKDDRKQQKLDEEKQQKDDRKQQNHDERKQQKEDDPSKKKENHKDIKADDNASSTKNEVQKPSGNKKDKSTKHPANDKKEPGSINHKKIK